MHFLKVFVLGSSSAGGSVMTSLPNEYLQHVLRSGFQIHEVSKLVFSLLDKYNFASEKPQKTQTRKTPIIFRKFKYNFVSFQKLYLLLFWQF